MIEEEIAGVERIILVFEAGSISDLVRDFKQKITSELGSGSFTLIAEIGDKSGVASTLTFIERRIWSRPYVASATFKREAKNKYLAIISVGHPAYRTTDTELKILDRVTNALIAVAQGVRTIYRGAWVYDDDEKVREKAISGLECVESSMALELLTELLRHDRSDAIRERAAQSLGRMGTEEAAEALLSAVSNYVNGSRSRHSVAAACAQALGTMRSRKAFESLNELLGAFEKKELVAEARTVRQAVYRIEHGEDLEETVCIVCNLPIEDGSELLQCPACKEVAHREHLLEWLHVKDYCPSCKKHVDEASIKRTRLENLPPKTATRKGGNQLTRK